MVKTDKSVNISAEYQRFCTKPSEEASFFQTGQNESKEWYPTIETYKNINISVEYQLFCMKLSEEDSSKLTISMVLHETFRTGLIFPSQSK